ncbi:hypothetical protein T01_915, partial [Trichinella spiralis]
LLACSFETGTHVFQRNGKAGADRTAAYHAFYDLPAYGPGLEHQRVEFGQAGHFDRLDHLVSPTVVQKCTGPFFDVVRHQKVEQQLTVGAGLFSRLQRSVVEQRGEFSAVVQIFQTVVAAQRVAVEAGRRKLLFRTGTAGQYQTRLGIADQHLLGDQIHAVLDRRHHAHVHGQIAGDHAAPGQAVGLENDRFPVGMVGRRSVFGVDPVRQFQTRVLVFTVAVHAATVDHRHLVENIFAQTFRMVGEKFVEREQLFLDPLGVVEPFARKEQLPLGVGLAEDSSANFSGLLLRFITFRQIQIFFIFNTDRKNAHRRRPASVRDTVAVGALDVDDGRRGQVLLDEADESRTVPVGLETDLAEASHAAQYGQRDRPVFDEKIRRQLEGRVQEKAHLEVRIQRLNNGTGQQEMVVVDPDEILRPTVAHCVDRKLIIDAHVRMPVLLQQLGIVVIFDHVVGQVVKRRPEQAVRNATVESVVVVFRNDHRIQVVIFTAVSAEYSEQRHLLANLLHSFVFVPERILQHAKVDIRVALPDQRQAQRICRLVNGRVTARRRAQWNLRSETSQPNVFRIFVHHGFAAADQTPTALTNFPLAVIALSQRYWRCIRDGNHPFLNDNQQSCSFRIIQQ